MLKIFFVKMSGNLDILDDHGKNEECVISSNSEDFLKKYFNTIYE